MDFSSYAKKLSKEQEKRAEKVKREAERNKREQARLTKLLAEEEEKKRLAKLEQLKQDEERQLAAEAQRLQSHGVLFRTTLRPVPYSIEEKYRGIRSRDKLALPPSARANLQAQGAEDHGLVFIEVSREKGGESSAVRTHGSVIEFTAQEGTVGVPPTIAKRLGLGMEADQSVVIRYVSLPKATFCKLQPQSHKFQKNAVEHQLDVREILEQELVHHSTLSEGDLVWVDAYGEVYEFRILELRPQPCCSVIDTDMEVDVAPSVEAVEAQAEARAEEERRQRQAEEAMRAAEAARAQEEAVAAAAAAAWEERRRAAAASLPQEPAVGDPRGVVTFSLKMPKGGRLLRRVAPCEPLRVLFDLVEAQGDEPAPNGFNLVASFPRRVFTSQDGDQTIGEAGLKGPQEALMLEVL